MKEFYGNRINNVKISKYRDLKILSPLCLHAAHVAFPYILTLRNKGYFRWMRDRTKVFAQCPKGLVMEISEDKVKIVSGECIKGHKKLDEFDMSGEIFKEDFDVIYPYAVTLALGKINNCNKVNVYSPASKKKFEITNGNRLVKCCGKDDCYVNIKDMCLKCKYHKDNGDVKDISRGLCFDAYHSVYPYCLALLYDAEVPSELSCPNGSVIFKIKSSNRKFKFFYEFLYNISRLIKPLDVISKKLVIEVVSAKDCVKNHKVGEKFEFDIGQFNGLCPAIFDGFYPLAYLRSNGVIFFDGELNCPDHIAKIRYTLKD